MRRLYHIQQKIAITRGEFSFLAILSGLLLCGMVLQYLNVNLKPLPEPGPPPEYTLPDPLTPDTSERVDHQTGLAEITKTESHPSKTMGPIDLNRATAAELETLPQIGPVLASAIVAYRTRIGAFNDVNQLVEVRGIGPKKLEKIRPYLYIRVAK